MTAVPDRLRDDAQFRRYWWSRVLSLTGTVISLIAFPVLVYRLSGSAFLTASVTALEAAPYVLFGLFAGALSDRWNRKTVMVASDLANAALVASVPLAYWAGVLTVPHVLVVAFATAAIATFFDAANFGALPLLVGRNRIAQANAAVFGASAVLESVLPALVGIALAVLNPATLIVIDAVSFVGSALCVQAVSRLLHNPDRTHPPLSTQVLLGDIVEGLRFLVGHPGVRTMTAVGTIQCIAGGGFVALTVVWCDQVLDIGTSGLRFGLVYGSWSVGSLLAAIALPRLLRRLSPAQVALRALPVSAALGIAAGLATWWPAAALGLFAWSCVYTLVVINSISYRQQVTPEELLGRVNTAGRMLSWGVGWTLGAVAGGALGHLVGIRPAMVAMAATAVVGVVIAWTSPLRSIALGHPDRTPTSADI